MRDILIVDDDPIIRQGLVRMMDAFPGRHAIHEAANGIEAMEKICLGCIGIVFTDIKMPVCDGLEMLQKMADIHYDGEVVMISGYDDFEFVRRAMRLGAADYILKPVAVDELRAAYQEALARVIRKEKLGGRRGLPVAIQEKLYIEQAQLERLLPGGPDAEAVLAGLGLSPDCRARVALLSLFSRRDITDLDAQTAYLTGISLQQKHFPASDVRLLQGAYKQLWAMVLLYEHAEDAPVGLEAALRQESISFGIAPQDTPAASLAGAFEEALRGFERYFYDIPAHAADTGEDIAALAETVADRVAARDGAAAMKAIQTLFDMIAARRPAVEDVRQLLASVIYTLMRRNKDFISIIGKYKFTDQDILQAVQESATLSALKKAYLSLVQTYMDALNQRLLGRDDYAIQKVKTYLENGYQGNPSLGEMAERLGLHPNYLSSLFHQKTGQTYSEYLRTIRIEKAIELMRTTTLKSFEIGQQVGYNDNAQFYRAFKQSTGISPGEYRKRRLE